jgi:hypothetical protein
MTNPMNWPVELPDLQEGDSRAEMKKTLLQGQIELRKLERQHELEAQQSEREAAREEQKAFWENEYKLQQAVHSAYLEVAKGQVDRANASAEFVQKAASAIATVYTSVAALTFVVNSTLKAPLPARGIAPALFLGLSIVLATAFRAYITKPESILEPASQGLVPALQRARRNTFIEWARSAPLARQYWLQTGVLSLGVGVLLLPLPYIAVSDHSLWFIVPVGLLVTFGLPALLERD